MVRVSSSSARLGMVRSLTCSAGLLLLLLGPSHALAQEGEPIKLPNAWAVPLPFGTPASGTFTADDPPLETVLEGNEGDTTFTDVFTVDGLPGQIRRFRVDADVPIFVALLNPSGQMITTTGADGDLTTSEIVWSMEEGGIYWLVVNAFYGDEGSYTASVLSATEAEWLSATEDGETPVSDLVPAVPEGLVLGLGTTLEGSFAPGDAPLEALIAGAQGDTTYADVYTLTATEGLAFVAEVSAEVPTYLALLDDAGNHVLAAGTEGDDNAPSILYVPFYSGAYSLVVNSYHGGPGAYRVGLRAAEEADIRVRSEEMPVDGVLSSGAPIREVIHVNERIYRTYTIEVPANAQELAIETECAGNIDLFVRRGFQILQNYNTEPDYFSDSETGNEALRISAISDPPLRDGTYYIDVAALIPVSEREISPPLPFTLTATLIQPQTRPVDGGGIELLDDLVIGQFGVDLSGGRRVAARIEPTISPVQIWPVQVDHDTSRLELRTYSATGRLDMVVAPPGTTLPTTVAEFFAMPYRSITARDNERIVIGPSSSPPLRQGMYTIAIFDLYSGVASDYEIAASMDELLPTWPAWEPPDDDTPLTPAQRAVRSTVQLSLSVEEEGVMTGSGTILTPDGIILTNHHVIGECREGSAYLYGCIGETHRLADGRPTLIFVGLSNENQSAADQRFVGQVIASLPEYDLALVRMSSDLDGRPIEPNLPALPFATDRNAVRLGDDVSAIGYPSVAGMGSRVSLSFTRGVVSGFTDDRGQRVLINVDANIARGNSGGALVNADGVLVGVPSNVHVRYDRGERQGYARSLNLLPPEWVEMLRAHGGDVR